MWEEPRSKTTKSHSFGPKPQFSVQFSNVGGAKAKNHGFWQKTVVFSQKPQFSVWFLNVGGAKAKKHGFQPKLQFSVQFSNVGGAKAKNCSFRPKTTVFDLSPTHFIENRGFQPQNL